MKFSGIYQCGITSSFRVSIHPIQPSGLDSKSCSDARDIQILPDNLVGDLPNFPMNFMRTLRLNPEVRCSLPAQVLGWFCKPVAARARFGVDRRSSSCSICFLPFMFSWFCFGWRESAMYACVPVASQGAKLEQLTALKYSAEKRTRLEARG